MNSIKAFRIDENLISDFEKFLSAWYRTPISDDSTPTSKQVNGGSDDSSNALELPFLPPEIDRFYRLQRMWHIWDPIHHEALEDPPCRCGESEKIGILSLCELVYFSIGRSDDGNWITYVRDDEDEKWFPMFIAPLALLIAYAFKAICLQGTILPKQMRDLEVPIDRLPSAIWADEANEHLLRSRTLPIKLFSAKIDTNSARKTECADETFTFWYHEELGFLWEGKPDQIFRGAIRGARRKSADRL